MITKGFQLVARPANNFMQRRGMAALKEWKRPSMDEYLGPKEPYAQGNAKRQKGYNMQLVGGVGFLAACIGVGFASGLLSTYESGIPTHLIPK